MSCKWDPCAQRGVFGECWGGVKCSDIAQAVAKVASEKSVPNVITNLKSLPIAVVKTDPCGIRGAFGECYPVPKTELTCPEGKKLIDGMCSKQ